MDALPALFVLLLVGRGAEGAPVDDPPTTGALFAPVPVWLVVFVVVSPVLLFTLGSSLFSMLEGCGPLLALAGFETCVVAPSCALPVVVVPGAY